ncbi:hypothetical protein EVG20_g11459 [Dentipellis fragilis]|uniref:RING-type domain-containing protein n=1 Tax=Dentipellis fragilis TaxID=205917 RepID=A0A4Y9XMX8_9AGAM|nr:hypothetical protein EVG20_g11459 [Dentipellis fragilis]
MPATRSAATVARSPEPYNKTSHSAPRILDSDVIIISSDEEDAVAPKRRAAPRTSSKNKTRAQKEVIDITSTPSDKTRKGESSRSAAQAKAKADAKEIARQKEALALYEKELERSKAEITKLKSELASEKEKAKGKATSSGGSSIPTDSLDDLATCEICTCIMWKPATLPDCGHTFCQSCLTDWFSTILAQHLTAHPHYNPNHPPPRVGPELLNALPQALHPYILTVMQNNSHPPYTCPTCRVAVRNRPVEVFALKNLVHTVAEAKGERPPPSVAVPAPVAGRATRGRAAPPPPPRRAENPWDGFFGKN